MLRWGHCCKQVALSTLRESATCLQQCPHLNTVLPYWGRALPVYNNALISTPSCPTTHYNGDEGVFIRCEMFVLLADSTQSCITLRCVWLLTDWHADGQVHRKTSVQWVSVRTYGWTIAGATNRLSVRTDGQMHGQLQWKAFVQWIASVYIRTDRLTAIDQSYVRQPRFGSQDAAIWGGELKDNLDK